MVLEETLSEPRRPNLSQHAMIPATTEACIIASAGHDTLSPGNRSRVGALAVSRSAEVVTSQVKAFELQSYGLGPFAFVTCQLPDVPPPWELERDARGLTFDVLTGCVGWTELVEGDTCLEVTTVPLDPRRLICLMRPSARDHSAPAGLKGHRKQPGVQTNQGKRPAGLARFGVYFLVRLYLPDSLGRQPRNFGVLPSPLASDLIGSVWPLWALTSLGLAWLSGPLTTLGLIWPSGL